VGTAKVEGQKLASDYSVGSTPTIDGTQYTIGIAASDAVTNAQTAITDKAAEVTEISLINNANTAVAKVGEISIDGGDTFYVYKDETGAVQYSDTDGLKYGRDTANTADGTAATYDKTWTDVQNAINAAAGKKVTFTPENSGNIATATSWNVNDDTTDGATIISATKAAQLANEAQGTTQKGSFNITKASSEVANTLSFNLHVGSDADMTNKINVKIDTMNSAYLGIKGLDVVGDGNDGGTAATYAIDAIADAVSKVSAQRSALGAVQNRLEHTIANLDNVVENTTSAESRIRDTDMAEEMVEYSKNNILAQAGQSMLAQANQSTQGVLSLLQ
jgi:flagellin